MGAWGHDAFSNDDAWDWFGELEATEDPVPFLIETLEKKAEDDYLELPDSGGMVAAASIIAAARGTTPSQFPDSVREWLKGKEASLQPLSDKALAALAKVRGEGSEMRDLWEESKHYAEWCAHLDEIAAALR